MSTRSHIAIKRDEGRVEGIYCHSDGYPSHNGRILQEHYQSEKKIERLFRLGDLSTLAKNTGKQHDFNWRMDFYEKYRGRDDSMYDDPEFIRLNDQCLAYGRDRGETGIDPVMHESLADAWEYVRESDREWFYLYDPATGGWSVTSAYLDEPFWVPLYELDYEQREGEEYEPFDGRYDEIRAVANCRTRLRKRKLVLA